MVFYVKIQTLLLTLNPVIYFAGFFGVKRVLLHLEIQKFFLFSFCCLVQRKPYLIRPWLYQISLTEIWLFA